MFMVSSKLLAKQQGLCQGVNLPIFLAQETTAMFVGQIPANSYEKWWFSIVMLVYQRVTNIWNKPSNSQIFANLRWWTQTSPFVENGKPCIFYTSKFTISPNFQLQNSPFLPFKGPPKKAWRSTWPAWRCWGTRCARCDRSCSVAVQRPWRSSCGHGWSDSELVVGTKIFIFHFIYGIYNPSQRTITPSFFKMGRSTTNQC